MGPSATLADAVDAGLLGLKVCANGDTLANLKLPESGALTRAQLEAAMKAALAALPESQVITMEDLREPPSGWQDGETVTVQGGTYYVSSTSSWSWSATCKDGKSSSGSGYSTSSAAAIAMLNWVSTSCTGGGTYTVTQDS